MDNKTAIESFNIFKQIENEKGLPLKFAYALGRIINGLEPIVKGLDKVRMAPIDGQQEYEDAKKVAIEKHTNKDSNGRPIQIPGPQGQEYSIPDYPALNADIEVVNNDHADAITAIKGRVKEFTELLEEELKDYKPYKINIKYLPVDDAGNCKLSVMQIRFLIPFLDGEIDDIPDPRGEEK
jgi:hypothetical protein